LILSTAIKIHNDYIINIARFQPHFRYFVQSFCLDLFLLYEITNFFDFFVSSETVKIHFFQSDPAGEKTIFISTWDPGGDRRCSNRVPFGGMAVEKGER
jgi:hypothetical protein